MQKIRKNQAFLYWTKSSWASINMT